MRVRAGEAHKRCGESGGKRGVQGGNRFRVQSQAKRKGNSAKLPCPFFSSSALGFRRRATHGGAVQVGGGRGAFFFSRLAPGQQAFRGASERRADGGVGEGGILLGAGPAVSPMFVMAKAIIWLFFTLPG